jgi:hypothetical protein
MTGEVPDAFGDTDQLSRNLDRVAVRSFGQDLPLRLSAEALMSYLVWIGRLTDQGMDQPAIHATDT